ncbi:RNA methyltransferase [Desulfothermus okinawensis JCM 13304]
MDNIAVILCRTKYSENIGSVARACVNMGVDEMILVSPKEFDLNKARPLATPKGKNVLERASIVSNLEVALENFNKVYGTTARTGGWRKRILLPQQAASQIAEDIAEGRRVALVFGPEDTGLLNEEIELCGQLITIPTNPNAWSLNVAQAVLIILYECFNKISFYKWNKTNLEKDLSRYATHKDLQLLFESLKKVLSEIDFLLPENPEYFMLPIKRFIHRINLKKNEFNMLMGICRQLLWYFNGQKNKEK